MARYRIVTDVVTLDDDTLTDRQQDSVRKEVEDYLHVVVLADQQASFQKEETHSNVHEHISTDDMACRFCSRVNAGDGLS